MMTPKSLSRLAFATVLAVVAVGSPLSVGYAISSRELAREQELLFTRLSERDPLKPVMALRLADLLFDASTEVDKSGEFTDKQVKEMEASRVRAIELYEKSLTGFNGKFAKPKTADTQRIEFQLARLYNDSGQFEKADRIWERLAAPGSDAKIRRESSLRRAEKLELSNERTELVRARKHYDVAVAACGGKDLCSYIYYRRGWVSHRLGESDAGLKDLLRALEGSDAAAAQDIVKEVILFLAHSTWSPEKGAALADKLGQQYNKPELLEQLSHSYFTADKRGHYKFVVQRLNARSAKVDRLVALIEHDYSEKNLPAMKGHFASLRKTGADSFTEAAKKDETEKILYRLIVQWDGELNRNPQFREIFDEGVALYSRVYPNGPQIDKVIDGWLAVEPDLNKKIARLKTWAAEHAANAARSDRLRRARLAIAVKAKNNAVIIDESTHLAQTAAKEEERRLFTYQQARAYYEQKQFEPALAIFTKLAAPGTAKPDSNAIYSQNIALDILASQKRYEELRAQAATWLTSKSIAQFAEGDTQLAKELADMKAISEKALFEKSSAQANTDGLHTFKEFCLADKFMPKSCENAKTLAVQLRDQDALIAILKKTGKKDELTSELEFGGHFLEAAQLLETGLSGAKATYEDHLKVAMLYEIGGDYKNRDRLLDLTTKFASKSGKLSEPQWEILYLSLRDAGLLSNRHLALAWGNSRKLKLAAELETTGRATAETGALLKGACVDYGAPWHEKHLAQLAELHKKQKSITFYGRNSQKRFEQRIEALKTLAKSSECYLKGVQPERRYGVFKTIGQAYRELAGEIRNTPIPEGVEGELLEQVKAQIEETAKPFDAQAGEWLAQAGVQLQKVEAAQRPQTEAYYASWSFEVPKLQTTRIETVPFSWQPLLARLKQNPFDTQTLAELKNHFQSRGQSRLAAYFEGRMRKE